MYLVEEITDLGLAIGGVGGHMHIFDAGVLIQMSSHNFFIFRNLPWVLVNFMYCRTGNVYGLCMFTGSLPFAHVNMDKSFSRLDL